MHDCIFIPICMIVFQTSQYHITPHPPLSSHTNLCAASSILTFLVVGVDVVGVDVGVDVILT